MEAILLNELDGFDEASLKELRAKADFLLKAKTRVATPGEELVYDIMKETLTAMGHFSIQPFNMFVKGSLYTNFYENTDELLGYIRTYMGAKHRADKRKCLKVIFSIVVRHMQNRAKPIPISLKTLIYQLPKIPALVDSEFPGYREAGLLPSIVRAHQQR